MNRKWPGPRPSRKGWNKHRISALRGKCEVESCGIDLKQAGASRHVDHIVPARVIRRLSAGNPDRPENLQGFCGTCHGYKLQADHKLYLGHKLDYLEILRTHQFDLLRVNCALAIYGLQFLPKESGVGVVRLLGLAQFTGGCASANFAKRR